MLLWTTAINSLQANYLKDSHLIPLTKRSVKRGKPESSGKGKDGTNFE